jgi:phosphomannomutase
LSGDLRPSSPRIIKACMAAILDAGGVPLFCDFVPSPALALCGISGGMPSLMITGSHIPDDRNGIKFNRSHGEILKADELAIRSQEVLIPLGRFDDQGMLNQQAPELTVMVDALSPYTARYINFFGQGSLNGLKIGVYQHSSVGRDILVSILSQLGADVVVLARSDAFVPVDTEAVRPEDVVLAKTWATEYGLDAICSTDGDADRPLISDESGNWLRGDILGILCAKFVNAKTVVTPVSSNSSLEKSGLFEETVRTRIGSPYVIEAMQSAAFSGGSPVCGYEANGGFLLESAVERSGKVLCALPTRDAVLPILAVLAMAKSKVCKVSDLLDELPARFTSSDRIKNFPTALSQKRIANFTKGGFEQRKAEFEKVFGVISGSVIDFDETDGLRVSFVNGEIIHLRPSGNAPELRCYTEAASTERSALINKLAIEIMQGWKI